MNTEPYPPQQPDGELPSLYGQTQQSPSTTPPPADVPPQVGPQGQKQSRRLPAGIIVLLIVLVVLLIGGGGGLIYYTTVYQPNLKHAQATATAVAQFMATAQAQATAVAQLTATAQAQATAAVENPYPPYQGTLALNDSLRDSSGNNFGEGSASGVSCQFTKGAYHVGTTGQSTALCVSPATDYSNFVYEVQMTIIKGDGGGVFFRADWNSNKLYHFFVGANGTYALALYTDSSHTKILRINTLSAAIHRGLNQTNLIAVVANGNTITLYINHQQLVSVNDSTYSHGQIGLVAAPYVGSGNPTEVAFNNAKVWTLP